jgi:hypothetical protein
LYEVLLAFLVNCAGLTRLLPLKVVATGDAFPPNHHLRSRFVFASPRSLP